MEGLVLWKALSILPYEQQKPNSILPTTKYFTTLKVRTDSMFCADFFLVLFSVFSKDIDGISVYIVSAYAERG